MNLCKIFAEDLIELVQELNKVFYKTERPVIKTINDEEAFDKTTNFWICVKLFEKLEDPSCGFLVNPDISENNIQIRTNVKNKNHSK